MASGDVYIDGSFNGLHWRAARAAWAAVNLSQKGEWRWTYSGTLGERHVSSYRAELTALLEVLRIAIGSIHLWCDNEEVVKGFNKGKGAGTDAKDDAADLWRAVWTTVEDYEGDIKVSWVKGHTTWIDVLERKISPHQHVGNDAADTAAKRARKWAEDTAPTRGYYAHLRRAHSWYKWVLDFITDWPYKEEKQEREKKEEEEEEGRNNKAGRREASTVIKHEVWRTGRKLLCRRCARQLGEGELDPVHRYEPCNGTAAGRGLAKVTGNVNHLWMECAIPATRMLQQGAFLVQVSAIPEARIDRERIQEFANTVEGRHTLKACLGEEHWAALRRNEDMDRRTREEEERRRRRREERERTSRSPSRDKEKRARSEAASSSHLPWEPQEQRGAGEEEGWKREEGEEGVGLHSPTEEEATAPGKEGGVRVRRRLRGKQRPPAHAEESTKPLVVEAKNKGHSMRRRGPVIFCVRCASYAIHRVGTGLKSLCTPSASSGKRLERLHQSRHPVTGSLIA